MRNLRPLRGIVLASTVLAYLSMASSASAVLVHLPDGHTAGVTFQRGVDPATVPGSLAGRRRVREAATSNPGNLDYHGGYVLHTSRAFLVFWDPSGQISAVTKNLFAAYLTQTAAASQVQTAPGEADVYGVGRQYADPTGYADESQAFDPASQVITDRDHFPARDTTNCPDVDQVHFPTCVTDAQLQMELTHLISTEGLPTGVGANAPVYFMITPKQVNTCDAADSCADPSSSNGFCAYHSSFFVGSHNVVYANIPLLDADKNCQDDGTAPLQAPNGTEPDATAPDVAIDNMSHEYNESITDPVFAAPRPDGSGWYSTASGQEEADNCEAFGTAVDPQAGTNPSAYEPTLGGDMTAGTLFDQSIDGGHYYTQSEWSNGDSNCQTQPAPGTVTSSFTAPTAVAPGGAASFDPSASTPSADITSATWNFGDGSAAQYNQGAPQATSHVYTTAGSFTVTLTLVDSAGNLVVSQHSVSVGTAPVASFTATLAPDGQSTVYDASASSDPNPGGSIVSYAWDFGDGTTASGVTVTHAFASPGNYTVTLTVTDSLGIVSSISQGSFRHDSPDPSLSISPSVAAVGAPVSFDGSGSTDSTPGASITGYAWTFGDGATATGAKTTHAYGKPGTYTATLTVTDSNGLQSEVFHTVTIVGSPTASLTVSPKHPATGLAVHFDGASSSDPSATITRYAWTFGDGSSGTGLRPSHTYHRAGSYTAHLTVTDANGLSSIATAVVNVVAPEKISKTTLKKAKGGVRLSLKLSGPGALRVGTHHFKIRRAKTVTVDFSLTRGQERTLSQRHRLVYQVGIAFTPQAGKTVRETAKVTLRSGS